MPVTGKSRQILWIVNGVPGITADQVTRFSLKTEVDEITTKALGRSGSEKDQEFVGHSGSFDFVLVTSDFQRLQDDLISKMIAGVKPNVTLTIRTTYDDAESESYTYYDVKCNFEESVSRGETVKCVCNWSTGKPRIRTT